MINSTLNYCILAWGYNIKVLTNIQKRLVRLIVNAKYNSHTEPIFKFLNLLKLSDIFKLNVFKFYYKYKQGTLPLYFQSYDITSRHTIHTYNTRHNHKLVCRHTRTHFARKCLRHSLPSIINSASNSIIEKLSTHSYRGFVDYVKHTILGEYSYECSLSNCYVCGQR